MNEIQLADFLTWVTNRYSLPNADEWVDEDGKYIDVHTLAGKYLATHKTTTKVENGKTKIYINGNLHSSQG